MQDLKASVDQVAALMDEFKLQEAELSGLDWRVVFRKRSLARPTALVHAGDVSAPEEAETEVEEAVATPVIRGTPITSPMNGVYYSKPLPNAPAFVRVGDTVIAGQTVALIEAMKHFNEVPCPVSGKVTKILVNEGQIVALGETILYVE